ncbi:MULTISPECIES: DUF423 domain-containing protein [Legionella]|uniref:DUF423 domain-containing protein n=1 Tax=Legionella drozanskii LLAP-1 TaxID=1212489 RepID=A0A0W0SQH2_9GAMM|nr:MULTISPECIES: DUF423 domain-containing protein [Legionella]KTC85616.1 hypothetical protein Ldro_1941 [Legionella drozanskii LLAP-1]PJE16155.1 MAG: DUF423 domain-containing protein [Legionella sp.]
MAHKTIISRRFIAIAALSAMIATMMGAFAAHGLKAQFSESQMSVFQTAVFYQFIHSLALLFLGVLILKWDKRILQISGWLFCFGILLFSGSLYLLSLLKIQILGMLTPFGGVCFILGWFLLAIGVYKST